MPESTLLALIVIFALAVAFDYINGFHDTANAIATSVSTRALKPEHAILLSAPELSRARGGPRCMTMPLVRDPV